MKISKSQLIKIVKEELSKVNEAAYEPGRAVADIDTGEEYISPEEVEEDEMRDLADKFGVEIEFDVSDFRDGSSYAKVKLKNGSVMYYYDAEEMYQDLAKRQEMK